MKKNKSYKMLAGQIKKNPAGVTTAAIILLAVAFSYMPQLQQLFGIKPSEAFDIYNGPVNSGIPISGETSCIPSLLQKQGLMIRSVNNPATGVITQGNNKILGTWEFCASYPVIIKTLSIDLSGTASDEPGEAEENFKLIRLKMQNGNIATGPVDASADGGVPLDREIDFPWTFVTPGTPYKYTLVANIKPGAEIGETVKATILTPGDVIAKNLQTYHDVPVYWLPAALTEWTIQ